MLKKLLVCILPALILSACISALEVPDVQPEKLPLTLKDGILSGEYAAAKGETPALFSVRKDQLGPLVRIRFDEGEHRKVAESVPAGAKWLQIFGIDFELPEKGGAALTAFDTDGRKTYFFAYDPVENENGTEWNGQLAGSGYQSFFRILVTKDGQIFNIRSAGDWSNSRMTYSPCYEFSNQEGKLAIRNRKEWIQTAVELPPYKPVPMTLFELNLLDILKHLIAMQKKAGLFRCMTVDEFKNFCSRAKGLKAGMNPDEVKTILGEPDSDVVTMAPKGPEGKRIRRLKYDIVRKDRNGVNLYIDSVLTLHFITAEDGSELLETAY